jgi:hypothetical protein
MDLGKSKEQFNIAYVCAMAAHAGLNHTAPVVDNDSVDLMLAGKGYSGKVRNPQIHLQLKCTSQDIVSGDVLKFPLSKKNYNDLRGENVVCPRYLVVLLVPPNEDSWVRHHDEHMSLHNRCYWFSLRNHSPSMNETKTTVDIPLAQRLTTDQLLNLMLQASNGVAL